METTHKHLRGTTVRMREIKTDIISTYQAVDVCYRTNQVDLIVLSL